jgi:hypothetical protein
MTSEFMNRLLADGESRYGPIPKSFHFGDGIDWGSALKETFLYVELPFWLMVEPGPVEVSWAGLTFTVEICPPWVEVFGGYIVDSRLTAIHNGPERPETWSPAEPLRTQMTEQGMMWMERLSKTVLRLTTRAHAAAFRKLGEGDPPRALVEQQTYWASLCEAHLPVVNELVQRYRLVTYDYYAYEVSAWDVPIWYLKHANIGYRAILLPYKRWDRKPVTIEAGDNPGDPDKISQFEWASKNELAAAASSDATPGEFDLLDARSLMERGDYSGAVRRTTTAVETIATWVLPDQLRRTFSAEEAERRLKRTEGNTPARFREWLDLPHPEIGQRLLDEFEATRGIRHEIVHEGRRLTLRDRGRAQRAVDTGRWLYNKIEAKPERARLRDYGVLKSTGRVTLDMRFAATVDKDGITLVPHRHGEAAVDEG